jgi:branched-chain amino acid transport system ATP-binding protein
VPSARSSPLLGTNGAGKTTTLRAISGLLGLDDAAITDGRVTFLGRDVTGRPPHVLARAGLVLVPERDKVFETLTVKDNLEAMVTGGGRVPVSSVVSTSSPCWASAAAARGYLSGGERQMLAIGIRPALPPRGPADRRAVAGAGPDRGGDR